MIPGREYTASLDDGSGRKRVVIAVQIPDSFDPAAPCLVLGPSSGSREIGRASCRERVCLAV